MSEVIYFIMSNYVSCIPGQNRYTFFHSIQDIMKSICIKLQVDWPHIFQDVNKNTISISMSSSSNNNVIWPLYVCMKNIF